jgi:O-antigen/teichoic acid export membrane protein
MLGSPTTPRDIGAQSARDVRSSGPDRASAADGHPMTRKHVRGSSLLLVGRGLGLLLNFATQVVVVRYLTIAEFGAFAYAFSIVVVLTKASELGLGKGLSRFLPIYHEHQDYPRLFGTLLLGIGCVWGVGVTLALAVVAFQHLLLGSLIHSDLSLNVLLVMVALTPLQALEDVMEKLFAVFAGARSVFFRRHLVGPLLRFAAVLALVLYNSNVYVLAGAYVAAGVMGAVISLSMFIRILRRQKLLRHFEWRAVRVPAREVLGFSLPLLSSDLVFLLRAALVVFFLEFFHGGAAVAAFRAVFPVARLNLVVFDSFKTLFVPTAARLFSRHDVRGINDLYWRNATWLAVLTFPIFMATCLLAKPTTLLLFGSRYAESAPILAVLSLGCFVNVVFGFSTLLLRVHGNVRAIVSIDLSSAVLALTANLILIPRFGAMGGALATCSTLALQNVLYQILLVQRGYVQFYDGRFVRATGGMLLAASLVLAFQWCLQPATPVLIAIGGLTTGAVFWLNARQLDVPATFPELKRLLPARALAWMGKA